MFDIGFQELLLIGVLSLLIMGPERLPGAIRTTTLWISRIRNSFQQLKNEIESEVGSDEIKQHIHNEAIMNDLEKASQQLQYDISDITDNHTQNNTPENKTDNVDGTDNTPTTSQ